MKVYRGHSSSQSDMLFNTSEPLSYEKLVAILVACLLILTGHSRYQLRARIMKAKFFLVLAPIALVIAGCSKAPNCSSADSTSVIKQIIDDQAKKYAAQISPTPDSVMAHVNFALDTIRTTAHDDTTGKYTCAATLSSVITDDEKKVVNNNSDASYMLKKAVQGLSFDGTTMSAPITYAVQLTDDKKSVYGEVEGGVTDLVGSRVMVANIVDSVTKKASTGAAAPQPALATVPAQQSADTKEVTVTGKIDAAGTSFVSLDTADGNGYSVPNDSDLAKKMLVACQYGDTCTVVGTVNDDQFVSIKSATKVASSN